MANKDESFEEFQQLPEEFSNHVSIINIRTQAIPYTSFGSFMFNLNVGRAEDLANLLEMSGMLR
jgi:hypothetical protein